MRSRGGLKAPRRSSAGCKGDRLRTTRLSSPESAVRAQLGPRLPPDSRSMTAVVAPISIQPLPRWDAGDGADSLNNVSPEEAKPILKARAKPQRNTQWQSSTSSASASSILSSTPNAPMSAAEVNGDAPVPSAEAVANTNKRKSNRAGWSSQKTEGVSAASTARSQVATAALLAPDISTSSHEVIQVPSNIVPNGRPQSNPNVQNGSRADQHSSATEPAAILALLPMTGTFQRKQIHIPFSPVTLKIGRQTNAKTVPTANNGYFDSKVLSRQHAEVWADRSGKIWIRDVKSSNGTFVNGVRLSPENRESEPHELRELDTLELGIDIVSEDQKSIVHHKVSAKVELAGIYSHTPPLLDSMHVDPHTGQQPSPGELSGQAMSHTRGRSNHGLSMNNSKINGNANFVGGNANMMGGQKQMNLWMAPITIEQVMRKLNVSASWSSSIVETDKKLDRAQASTSAIQRLTPNEGLL